MDEKEKNLTQNEPAKPAEAPQEAEKAQAPQEGGANAGVAQEPASEATEAVSEDVTVAPRGRETIMLDEELVMSEPATAVTEAAPVVEKRAMAEVAGPKLVKKSHKGLIITIIVTVVLALGAGVAWWFMAGPGKTVEENAEIVEEEKESSNGGSLRPVSTKPNSGGSSNVGVISLEDVPADVMDFYNVMVIDVYKEPEAIFPAENRWWIYADADMENGIVPKYIMLGVAEQNLSFEERWSQCTGEYYYYDDLAQGRVTKQCVPAEKIRVEVKKIFGVDIELNTDDHIGMHDKKEVCGTKDYNLELDEFYTTDDGCGGTDARIISHWLTKAERNDDEVWLYETAVLNIGGSDLWTIGPNIMDGELIMENLDEYSEENGIDRNPKNITNTAITGKFNQYIWKFAKNANGGYDFKGLVKVK